MVRARVPALEEDRYLAPDIAAAAEMIRSGILTAGELDWLPAIDVDAR
jgi:histidine ammonia-lyase